MYMAIDIENRVLYPHRVMKAQWGFDKPPAARRQKVEAFVEAANESLCGVGDRGPRGVQHGHLQRVHVVGRGLVVPEVCVHALQSVNHAWPRPLWKTGRRKSNQHGELSGI